MRIAQVVSSYRPQLGGVETHVERLAAGLVTCGDQVTVLTHRYGNSPVEEWIGGVRILRFPRAVSHGVYELSPALFRYLRSHKADFDLVHAHSYHTLAGHAAARGGLPFVFTPHYHGTGHTAVRAFLHRIYRPAGARVLRAADAVICVSDAERVLLGRDFPSTAGKAVTIPNGCGPGPGLSQGGRPPPAVPLVLTIGRLERYKNVDLIIHALAVLPPSAAALVVVGDGPDRERLERHRRAAGPGLPVFFTGRIPDPALAEWLARAHAVVSASDHEAFGLTLASGLAAGARVVASAIPAHAELASRAGAAGYVRLADPRDTRAFAAALAESLSAGRIAAGSVRLPSWADAVAATRELYGRLRVCAAGPGNGISKPVTCQPAVPTPGESA